MCQSLSGLFLSMLIVSLWIFKRKVFTLISHLFLQLCMWKTLNKKTFHYVYFLIYFFNWFIYFDMFCPCQRSWRGDRDRLVNLSICPSVCLSVTVVVHFLTSCLGHWYQTWWVHSLWYSPGLINFWSGSAEFPLFPGHCIFKQFLWFADKLVIWLSSNLVGQAIKGHPSLINIWSYSSETQILSPPLWINSSPRSATYMRQWIHCAQWFR